MRPRTVKPVFGNLTSDLSRLAERAASASREEAGRLAARAPLSRADKIAVSMIVADTVGDPLALVQSLGVTPANRDGHVVEAYVHASTLAVLSDAPGIERIEPVRPPAQREITSEGTRIHNATTLQKSGVTGLGVKVGIIDVGFLGLRDLLGVELPARLVARCYTGVGEFSGQLSDCEQLTAHGSAMAEILTDVAPGVMLYVANPISRLDLRQTMRWMTNQGVRVISHSVSWMYDGPGDGTTRRGDSPLRTVNMAVRSGALWINAAGNEARSTWTGPYRDDDGDRMIEFSGSEGNKIDLLPGEPLVIQMRWDDSWGRAVTDLDLRLRDSEGKQLASSDDVQVGDPGDDPLEVLMFRGAGGRYSIEVEHFAGPAPRWIQLQAFTSQELSASVPTMSIGAPADSANPGFLAAGAAHWRTPSKIAPFSSRGPTRDGRVKPDLVGVNGVGSASLGRFRGTSQAAPHIAGLAALALQLRPNLAPAGLASLLKSQALPRGVDPNNAWGHGLAYLGQVPAGQ